MRYRLRTLAEYSLRPLHAALTLQHRVVTHPRHPLAGSPFNRYRAAAVESLLRLTKDYPKQRFDYAPIEVDGQTLPVREEVVVHKPFCELRRFSTTRTAKAPKLLFVAAMSGHHATLSKDTLREFLPDFDVYITDWVDARLVPLAAGNFGLDDYIQYLIEFLETLGPDVHLVGLCQAAVPALCAAAVMAEDRHRCRPRTLSLLAGPIDVRVNPNSISRLTEHVPLAVMRLNIHKVPRKYPGAGRRVFPGYLQLMNFISLNPRTHLKKHLQFFRDVSQGNDAAAAKHRDFYDEYNAVMDATAEFYLETLERVFFDQQLAKGTLQYKGRTVNCAAIRDIALLTLEGEDDDMVAIGVTGAAQGLCSSLPERLREHHVQSGVGHYGVFNGSIFKAQIAPRMRAFMQRHGQAARRA
ncbi:polyhydroxyalkanoate depolymerase [Pseudomonas sp. N040]|uniref:polyhydroxyalkanoate depolymerase n=1 Tax=Pseudomonas sp. N040 TaxID=2785325 RepID=UPI0018A286BB|nr:polyhydroxyalkanoate depolymerase [Pseudomonas sp. N040]MBF7731379.1 polyhydroxyalkanoate depolymerase [Pseudomonas sp. N040]MBW7015022.1 polyhydroxyalkanoate depolymerase [Pseudomonas sp. N040]